MTRAVIFVCTLLLTMQACVSQESSLPDPSGDYPVGTTHLLFADPKRPELFTDEPEDHREVTVRVWYPGEASPGAGPAPYYEDAATIVERFGYPSQLGDIVTNSLMDIPVSERMKSYPVILFNHGWGEHAVQNTVLMEELASHGYIVFSIWHHYEAKYWAYPDGRLEFLNAASSRFQQIMQEQGKPEAMNLLQAMFRAREVAVQESLFRRMVEEMPILLGETPRMWAEDISFIVDELDSLNGAEGVFAGRLDLGRIGVMGMSMGGAAAAQVCLGDQCVKAAMNIDGGLLGDLADSVVSQPMMYMGSRRFIGYDEVFSSRASGDSYTVIIPGADHYDFTDFTLLNRQHPMMGSVDGHTMLGIMNDYTLAFFDFYLKGKDSELLAGKKRPYSEVDFHAHRKSGSR